MFTIIVSQFRSSSVELPFPLVARNNYAGRTDLTPPKEASRTALLVKIQIVMADRNVSS